MKILAIIPARGGSKGVPGKNRKLLGGKPLVVYSIDSALACDHIDEVMVSTEDEEIAALSRLAGAKVPFLRPSEYARDESSTISVLEHVIQKYEEAEKMFEAICLLQPTVPFRSREDLYEAIQKFKGSDVDTLISMRRIPHKYHADWSYKEENGQVRLLNGGTEPITRRQELSDLWHRDGSIYICKWSLIKEKGSLYGESIIHHEMKNSPDINIDTMQDWNEAEKYLKRING